MRKKFSRGRSRAFPERVRVWAAAVLLGSLFTVFAAFPASRPVRSHAPSIAFEPNAGQTGPSVQFLARGRKANLLFKENEIVLSLQTGADSKETRLQTLRLKLLGANPDVCLEGLGDLPGKANYFSGNDSARWRTAVPTFARVRYREVYPDVDLIFYGNDESLEYDFILRPGADADLLRLELDGSENLAVDAAGDLLIGMAGEVIRQHKPIIYQEVNGSRREVSGGYRVLSSHEVGFAVGNYNRTRPLIIDPVLSYSRTFGGSGLDQVTGVTADAQGNTYVVGNTTSLDFPLLNPLQTNFAGFQDVFLARFDTNGVMVFSTFLGGQSVDAAQGIALDSAGNIYITGYTRSTNFPTANALQSTNRGNYDVFITKLNPLGNALLYSTYLGGGDFDTGGGIAVDSHGNAIVTGYTQSTNFPTANAIQPVFGGIGDAFVCKLNAAGDGLIYSTYLGGKGSENRNNDDLGGAVAVDSAGNAYVTGWTYSLDFPVLRPFQAVKGDTSGNAATDAFVTKFDPAGAMVYSTYLGGDFQDKGRGIAVDALGNAYVAGATDSDDFPIRNSVQGSMAGEGALFLGDAFVTALDASGTNLLYSTFIGGSGDDQASGIAVDANGNAAVAGFTDSIDFPVRAAAQTNGNQGLFKSTSGGASWSASNHGLKGGQVEGLQVDPQNPAVLYAVTRQGIFKSTDAGANWNAINTGIDPPTVVRSLALEVGHSTMLYVGAVTGVFKTSDAGAQWVLLNAGLPDFPGVETLAVDPVNPSTLYAGTLSDGLFKSVDAGNHWTAMNNGLTISWVTALLVDPQTNSTIYAGGFGSGGVKLFRSLDGGSNWIQLGGGLAAGTISGLAFDPANSAIVYAISGSFGSTLSRSTNGGASWSKVLQSSSGFSFTQVAVDPKTPGTIYLGTEAASGQGVLKSADGGLTWNAVGPNGVTINSLALDPVNPANIYLGIEGGRDSFLSVLTPNGTLAFATYFGGLGADEGRAVAWDSAGTAYLAGSTASQDFPKTGGNAALLSLDDRKTRAQIKDTAPAVNKSDGSMAGFAQLLNPNAADLVVTVSVEPALAGLNDEVIYTVELRNNGPDEAEKIQLTYQFPDAPRVDILSSDCPMISGASRCPVIESMPAGSRIIYRIKVRNRASNPVQLKASVFARTFDPNRDNNSASAGMTPKKADLSVKVSTDSFLVVGQLVTFTVEVSNNGPNEATDTLVSFDLSEGYANLTDLQSECTGGGGHYTCNIGTLEPGKKVTRTFTARVQSAKSFTWTGIAVSSSLDPNTANNRASSGAVALNLDLQAPFVFAGAANSAITLKGFGLTPVTGVTFNTTPASFRVVNDFTIEATVPAGAGSGPITVTTTAGTAATPVPFTVLLDNGQPVIGKISDPSGSPGSYIVITGVNLAGASVTIRGVNAPVDLLRSTSNQLVVQIPAGATTGTISVTTFGGTTISPDNFTVIPCPGLTIESFPPTLPNGITGQDYFTTDPVTITGIGGQAGNAGFHFTVAGSLPPGLELVTDPFSEQARIAGTPRVSGTFTFIVTMTDGHGCSVSKMFTIKVDAGPSTQIAVTTSEDSGPGSFRDAINQANAHPGSTIYFAIPIYDPSYNPASEIFTLRPLTPLPPITAAGTRIEGNLKDPFTGNTADNQPNVVLNGSLVQPLSAGLKISAEQCVVQNFICEKWTGNGVECAGSLELSGMCQFNGNGGDGVRCGGALATESLVCQNNAGWGAVCQGDLTLNVNGGGVQGLVNAEFCGKGGFCSAQGAVIGASVQAFGCGQNAATPAEGGGICAQTFINITTCQLSDNKGDGCAANDVTLHGDCEISGNGRDGIRAVAICSMDDAYIHDNAGYGCNVLQGDAEINLGGKQSSCRVWLNGAGGICVPHGTCTAFNLDVSNNKGAGLRCQSADLTGCDVDFNQGIGCEVDGGTCELLETECVGNSLSGMLCTDSALPQNLRTAPGQGLVTESFSRAAIGPRPAGVALFIPNLISKSLIASNGADGIRYEQARALLVKESNLSANGGFGLNNAAGKTIVQAQQNWWGDASGPSAAGPGRGDRVSGQVDFGAWRTEPVHVTIAPIEEPIYIAAGEERTVTLLVRNWSQTNGTVQVTFGDPLGWTPAPAFHEFLLENGSALIPLLLSVPANVATGTSNTITVSASSTATNAPGTNSATFVVRVQEAERPRLVPLGLDPGGNFLMHVLGSPDVSYTVEASADLIQWITLTNRVAGQRGFIFVDHPDAPLPYRFYRARKTP